MCSTPPAPLLRRSQERRAAAAAAMRRRAAAARRRPAAASRPAPRCCCLPACAALPRPKLGAACRSAALLRGPTPPPTHPPAAAAAFSQVPRQPIGGRSGARLDLQSLLDRLEIIAPEDVQAVRFLGSGGCVAACRGCGGWRAASAGEAAGARRRGGSPAALGPLLPGLPRVSPAGLATFTSVVGTARKSQCKSLSTGGRVGWVPNEGGAAQRCCPGHSKRLWCAHFLSRAHSLYRSKCLNPSLFFAGGA